MAIAVLVEIIRGALVLVNQRASCGPRVFWEIIKSAVEARRTAIRTRMDYPLERIREQYMFARPQESTGSLRVDARKEFHFFTWKSTFTLLPPSAVVTVTTTVRFLSASSAESMPPEAAPKVPVVCASIFKPACFSF